MNNQRPLRRRSPKWVRELDLRTIHAMVLHFNGERQDADLTQRQERLYDCLVSELEYRRRHAIRNGLRWCSCFLCLPPDAYERSPGWREP